MIARKDLFVNNFLLNLQKFLFLIIQHAMAVAFEVGISDLLPEFFANALVLLGTLQAARTVSAGAFKALFDGGNHFFIFVESDGHMQHFLSNR